MRSCLMIFICLLLLVGCTKTDDVKGNSVLRGRLFYNDPYLGDGSLLPVAGKSIKISKTPSDTLNFLYSIKTDNEGYFIFNRVEEGKNYALFFNDSISGVNYSAFRILKPKNDTISLIAYPDISNENVLNLITTDANNEPVKTSICIFNNRTAFNADTCLGSIDQVNTDIFGRYVRYNLPSGKYYFRAKAQIGNVVYKGGDSIIVTPYGVTKVTIQLQPAGYFFNTVKINSLDANGFPVNNTRLCIFNNRTLFNADTCLGSVYSIATNNNGEGVLTNVTPGKYFIQARAEFGNIILKGKDSVIVVSAGVINSIVILK